MSTRKQSNVKIIKELFPHWNEDDLDQVLIDVNGVLESAVARISEGHASQFSTVQSKKEKKAAAPSVPTTTPPAPSKPKSNTPKQPRNTNNQSSRGQPATRGSFNPPRGPRGGSARSSTRHSTTPAKSTPSNSTTPAKWSDPSTSSEQGVVNSTATGTGTGTSTTTTNQLPSSQPSSSAALRSWAQIAKPPSPKPETIVETVGESVVQPDPIKQQELDQENHDHDLVHDHVQVQVQSQPNPPAQPHQDSQFNSTSLSQPSENLSWDQPTTAWNNSDSVWPSDSTPTWDDSKPSEQSPVKQSQDSSKSTQQTNSSAPPGFGAPPKPNSRAAQRARQDAAVVMPGASDNKSLGNAIGVQFGSLSLLDNGAGGPGPGPGGYEEQPDQSEQLKATQPQQDSVSINQPEPSSASVAVPAPAPAPSQPSQPVQPVTQQPTTQQSDISAYTSQQPQQDVYGQYFQQPQQQPSIQPTEPTQPHQPVSSQAIPPQFQQYNQTVTPTPDAYSNVFSNLGAQPGQLGGGAFGQQTQNDYAALYNDQAQRVSAVFCH